MPFPALSSGCETPKLYGIQGESPTGRELQVRAVGERVWLSCSKRFPSAKHVDTGNSYLCGYLKIKGLTERFILQQNGVYRKTCI
ncbi:uncharacterized protein [Oryctolagus cuniculus]|uniref:uncharacterized protein isoform X3 n=1 Tax=Oryctolagus cuniculus TaxID=9986 RepID=UPI00387A4244